MNDEPQITEEQVRKERLASVDQRAHWLYLALMLGASVLLMLALIALLGATS